LQTGGFCASIHHLATSSLASKVRTASVYKAEKFSDHPPLTTGYDFNL
jgi:exodeoxyribonuclease-3